MTNQKNLQPSVGRPRSEQSKKAILNATISLLEQSGYSSLTIDGIAARAEVSKATIYRWWSNKNVLIIDAFLMQILPQIEFQETLSVREKFLKQLQGLSNVFNSTLGRTMLAIISESDPDSEVVQIFHTQYLAPRRAAAKRILEIGIACGEIRSEIDLDVTLDMIYGPLYFRVLIFKKTLDPSIIEILIDNIMKAICLE
ncbi:TetR/AcrR family transcriptional regulator [Paenibacillus solisilvae]|uniref:TetR/AcrR family transcriptional regulator n=1 Tax=Paenibacillus solisilvae TaxID=2486751 RepID=A0ABW0W2B0_9BACL